MFNDIYKEDGIVVFGGLEEEMSSWLAEDIPKRWKD